ncbi:MAG: hypothetical protein ACK5X0_11365 [Rhodospirillales bacterium]
MAGQFHPGSNSAGLRNTIIVASILTALGGGALYVTFVLPGRVANTPPAPVSVAAPANAPTRPIVRVEQERAEFIERRSAPARKLALLESEGARIWGRPGLGAVALADGEIALAQADAAASSGRYVDASNALDAANTALDALVQSKPYRLIEAMAAARTALEKRAVAAAADAFAIALAIAPNDPEARAGQARAARLPEALAHFAEGEAAIAARDLRRAREAYARALSVDPALDEARTKLADVDARLAQQTYQSAISISLDRLAAGDTRAAQDAIERARGLRPNAPEVADIGQRIAARVKSDDLARFRAEAELHEAGERWREAVAAYDRALAIDSSAGFAVRARARAVALSDLHAVLDRYLDDPARLQSTDPRAHAKAALDAAQAEKMGPVIRDKADRLAQALAAAQRPIAVTLRSDGITAVEVLRVGSFGAFASREITLPPGSYVAIGRRSGFRDVRVTLEVSLKENLPLVEVACKDPLR